MYLNANSVDEIVRLVTETHDQLSQQSDLSPKNEKVNFLLTRLVDFVKQDYPRAEAQCALNMLDEKGIVQKLRSLCHEAEFQLEKYYLEKCYVSIISERQSSVMHKR